MPDGVSAEGLQALDALLEAAVGGLIEAGAAD
jgi:hypothetical protein